MKIELRRTAVSGLVSALVAGACCAAWASGAPPAAVEDWYLRESLAAIRDWEAALDAWVPAAAEAERLLAFPVPRDGTAAAWPNPVPESLIPARDAGRSTSLRVEGSAVRVESRERVGEAARTTRVKPGERVIGYWHPGGGAKDRWYHAYHRRFDALGMFHPVPAPFRFEWATRPAWHRGANQAGVALRNVSEAPLEIALQLEVRQPEAGAAVLARRVSLAPGAVATVPFAVDLAREGGAFLLLHLEADGGDWRIPLLVHVEQVSPIVTGLRQILADRPDEDGRKALAGLEARLAAWRPDAADAGAAWRALFLDASALRDRLLLARIGCEALLFVRRKPFDSEQPWMDAHHLRNRPGGDICRLAPVRPDGTVTPVVNSLGEGIYRDLCLHWDATRFLFAFGNGNDDWDGGQSYDLYEAGVDGRGLRRLTSGPKNDAEPFYLPNGQIGFTSDRSEHFAMCGDARHAPNLHVMEADGSAVRQLSFNVFNDFCPTLLPDGRILYSRWEYNERSVTSLHHPFTIFPDGTMMSPYYGNATIRPNVVQFPRPVAGSGKIMALFTGHHGQTHGAVGLIDRARAVDGPEAVTLLTPRIPVIGEKAEDSRFGWYSDPWPLEEDIYLCSFTPTVVPCLEWSWALYVGDRHGNLGLVYRDPDIACAEPVPLTPRPRPHVLPPAPGDTDSTAATATLMVQDAHVGLPGVPRGQVKGLRILEDMPRKGVHEGGVVCTSGTSIYTVKRVLGVVPVDPDGSAHFTVPANRNVYFEALDGEGLEIQRMRSVVCLKPGENRSCTGCHESRLSAPLVRRSTAFARPPAAPEPPPWGTRPLSFLRDIQPILNARCLGCHAFDRGRAGTILTDDLTDRFTVAYEELLPYLAVADAMRWDHPDDVLARPPYTYGSAVSALTRLLRKGHYDVRLSPVEWQSLAAWIDANAVYYDRYESAYGDRRSVFSGAHGRAAREVHARRCAGCHGKGDGAGDTWWLSLNRRDPAASRALMAPLARAAGGWGRCEGTVFANRDDPDYRALHAALAGLHAQLRKTPREDLLSLRGTPAEAQSVSLPVPPPPSPPADILPDLPPGEWVSLSDLPWTKGVAGWTHDDSGRPRRDLDVEDRPLRVGARSWRKGIGTHAPSEIAWRLDGAFDRFAALPVAGEAGGSVVFRVFADDRCVYDSGLLQGLSAGARVEVPVTDVGVLRLAVSDAGDGIACDMANWVGARLRRAAARLPGLEIRAPFGFHGSEHR